MIDSKTLRILSAANIVFTAMIVATYLYASLFRWYQVLAIRQNSYLLRFDRMTISERRLTMNMIPVAAYNVFRIAYFSWNRSRNNELTFWENQTEFSLMIDLIAPYFFLAFIPSKLFAYY